MIFYTGLEPFHLYRVTMTDNRTFDGIYDGVRLSKLLTFFALEDGGHIHANLDHIKIIESLEDGDVEGGDDGDDDDEPNDPDPDGGEAKEVPVDDIFKRIDAIFDDYLANRQ